MAELIKHSFGLTFERQSKAPLEDKRIFDTLALAKAYVDDKNQNGYVGLTISVVADTNPKNNGYYYVEQVADSTHVTGKLVKMGNDAASDIEQLNIVLKSLQENVSEIKVKDVDSTPSNGVSLVLDESGKVKASVDLETIAEKVIEKHTVTSNNVTITDNVGDSVKGDDLQSVLERLYAQMASIENDGITSIVEGSGISIEDPDSNTPRISVNVASNSSLRADANGLDMFWMEMSND
ncbi:MAG: hypothetical protein J6V44_11935 [Methanobrevibacter sp.]|nr:hypothetical protein [Methanobrevibacter sp.]